jgi:predicted HD phosphohydrolase
MEKILIAWLESYTESSVSLNTAFKDLNFDIFDEAMTVDFVQQQFHKNVNTSNQWFDTVKDLLSAITASS